MSEWTKTGERIKAPDVETKTGVGQKSHSGTKSLLHPRTNNLQFLQRNLGNQAMQRLFESGTLQAKLQVSIPDDIYEQEADKVAHTVMRMPVLGVQRHLGLSINPQLANIENDTGQRLIQTETITTDLTIPIQRQITGNGEGQMRLTLGRQTHYGVIEKKRRTPMAIETGVQSADEILWTVKALFDKAEQMKVFLKDTFGKDRDLRVTSVVKEGEHTAYRKMDVVPAGNTAWEELAVAAAHAGFWVHAEGVRLEGKYWPLSPAATGAHLDLYLIKREFGDYPMPSTAGNHEERRRVYSCRVHRIPALL